MTVIVKYEISGNYLFKFLEGTNDDDAIIKLWGTGGAGGGRTTNGGGGGGAGGQFAQKTITINDTKNYSLIIPPFAGGTTGDGATGADVTWDTNVVIAKGGAGGLSDGTPGTGSTTGGVGDVIYRGGDGAPGDSLESGAGGGGAGTTGNGGDASGITGGIGADIDGGDGGIGRTTNANGGFGGWYGAGGGGAFRSTSNRSGGLGRNGKAEIHFDVPPMNGTGTSGDPYIIMNWFHLEAISDDLDAYYKLGKSLSKFDYEYLGIGDEWEPIEAFEGVLDGDGHTISDLVVDISGSYTNTGGGLFGDTWWQADSCEIKNLGLVNVDINCTTSSGSTVVGSAPFIGVNNGTLTIENCFVRGGDVNIDGSADFGTTVAGGLVGWERGTLTINKCYSVLDSITASNTGMFGGAIVGGILMGSSAGTNTFWNTTTSGVTTSDGGTGKTTAEMKDIDTYTDTATTGLDEAWDMVATADHDDETWFLGNDMGFELYPQLKGERKFIYDDDVLIEDFESGSITDGNPKVWIENPSFDVLSVHSDYTKIGDYGLRLAVEDKQIFDSKLQTNTFFNNIQNKKLGFWMKIIRTDTNLTNSPYFTYAQDANNYIELRYGTFAISTFIVISTEGNTVQSNLNFEFLNNKWYYIELEMHSNYLYLRFFDSLGTILVQSDVIIHSLTHINNFNISYKGNTGYDWWLSTTDIYFDNIICGYGEAPSGSFVNVKISGSFVEKPLMIKKDGTFENVSDIQGGGWT